MLFDANTNNDSDIVQDIECKEIALNQVVTNCIDKIIVKSDSIEVHVKTKELGRLVSINVEDKVKTIAIPYKSWRHKKGTIILSPKNSQEDPLDLPSDKLKKLIQGIIWRDEHFSGITLKDISRREDCSEAYVGTAIFSSLEFLQKHSLFL